MNFASQRQAAAYCGRSGSANRGKAETEADGAQTSNNEDYMMFALNLKMTLIVCLS